jgi:hypothetical protein
MPFEVRDEADLAAVMQAARTSPGDGSDSHFEALGADRYRLFIPTFSITIEVDPLRRERHELFGELSVLSDMPGTRRSGSAISIADFNFSSASARQERAKLLADRSRTETLDWGGVIEQFCQLVLVADRKGSRRHRPTHLIQTGSKRHPGNRGIAAVETTSQHHFWRRRGGKVLYCPVLGGSPGSTRTAGCAV